MRRTVMRMGDVLIRVETDDTGTDVLDDGGMVIAEHGSDRHDEVVEERAAAGWQVAEDSNIRPPEAEGTPPPPDGPAGPMGEVDSGPSS